MTGTSYVVAVQDQKLYRIVFRMFILMSISFSAIAVNTSPSVFYPLPVQAQGNFLAAKNLYLGAGGGLWIHDVHGKVLFMMGKLGYHEKAVCYISHRNASLS